MSDFFFVWLRRSLGSIFPALFSTLLTPKAEELIASSYRFDGSKESAERFFEGGFRAAFSALKDVQDNRYPLALFYAFRQAESTKGTDGETVGAVSTGWETMLEGLLQSGFGITGTWPMRSELGNRMIASGTNALASSIVLVCRPRSETASLATRKEFLAELRKTLPRALRTLQHGAIAPVDLAQASIGPGMAVFSQYSKILEADGTAMRVRVALGLINQVLDEVLTEQESDYDASTRWSIAWFEQEGTSIGKFGDAETLSRAKGVSVNGLVDDGIIEAKGGKVRLLSRSELDTNWDPVTDKRLTVWEVCQNLVRALDSGGEQAAAALLRRVGTDNGERARDLAYRLYSTCERKKWAQEALAYNALVVAWREIVQLASASTQEQTTAF